jgi:hypothetical protein
MVHHTACRRPRPALVNIDNYLAASALHELHGDLGLCVRKSARQQRVALGLLAGMGERRYLDTGMVNFTLEHVARRGRLTGL